MKKFEYACISLNTLETNEKLYRDKDDHSKKPDSIYKYFSLNHFGDDGWELVSVVTTWETGTTYYFKREKSE